MRAALGRAQLRGKRVAIGLSGGIDSVVLLDVLARLAPALGLHLEALHVNHRISPNAYRWEGFCRASCGRAGVPLTVRRVALGARRGKGLEAAARDARYAALAAVNADCVALAHQLDDQAETVLLNLLRGAGMRGAAAMPEFGVLPGARECGTMAIRPLLGVSRDALVDYARRRELEWIEDESNADERLARNYLRRRIGPMLEERWPRWREALARAAGHFARAAADERSLLREFLSSRGMRAPSEAKLIEMLRQLSRPRADARTAIAHDGVVLRTWRGSVRLARPAATEFFEPVRWKGEARLPLPALGGSLLMRRRHGVGIDTDRLAEAAVVVKLRSGGERLRLAGNRPSRTLKNLFQEAGVPPWERDRLPLLFCGETLVWVPGLGIDVAFRAVRQAKAVVPEWRESARNPLFFTRKNPAS
ncbi:MAG: tRNA lysidine(34) synthetase TilS [Betaproteobacteria bacterium]|nr:tRNA lysidine(34) synthetase TilS [Betaproteobacteria bacterium]